MATGPGPARPASTLTANPPVAALPARPPARSSAPTSLLASSRAAPAMRLTQPATAQAVLAGRVFRTRDGKLIELPEGMTAEEAAKLEAEALAAQSQLGKGPAPQPVPDVKKLVKKDEKKAAIKPKGGVKHAGGKGRTGRKASAAGRASLKVGGSKVAQYLAAKGLPVQQSGLSMVGRLAQNEQTHDDAGQKLQQSEKAVVNPPDEGQSKSNAGQVDAVSVKPAPAPNEAAGKQKLQGSLQENTPKKIEDVDNFKRDMKAQHIGADVLKVVQGDTNAVGATFGDVKTTPPPAPPEQTPETLPPQEVAPATPPMNLGQGAIAPLQKEHTDVSNYTREADSKLKEEGVTQEQLDMVDSGDLAAANKEKKGLEQTAKTEPLAIQQFSEQENTRVAREMGQQEKQQREKMKAKRKAGLGATAAKQKGTKSALEKKREEVAKHINGIYTRAQDSVKKKLVDLETTSMKRFDDGNAKAAKDFEDNVNREIDAFKEDRYSGWFGWARRARDWLKGIDDLPQVKAIFDRNRAAFVNTINKLVEDITADNKKVIQGCKEELANAKKEIEVFVKGLKPGLQDIGKKAAEEMNGKLAEMDQFITNKEEELQNNLKDKQTAAIKAIDEKIEKMKEAMSGALAKLGKLLLWAAKKFFTWALEKFGMSLSDIQSIIDKGVAVLKAIFTGPIKFVKNLMKAAMLGFEMFRDHFLDHLKRALFEWLTDSLEGIQLPSTWDLKGIISVVLQVVGISYANLRRFLVEELTESVVAGLEKGASLIATLFKEGPMAAWQQLQGMVSELSEAFQAAVKDYIKQRIIIEAVKWVVSLFIPGAGIIKAIIGIYDTIVFFVQKIKEIIKMIANFLSSIGEIAAGNIGAAAKAMEEGLARGLKLVISFLARLLRLSGITNAIKAWIGKIKGKVDDVLRKLAQWIAAPLKKVYAVAKAGVQKGVQAVKRGGKEQVAAGVAAPQQSASIIVDRRVEIGAERHTIRVQIVPPKVQILMASNGYAGFRERLQKLETQYRSVFAANPSSAHLADILHTEITNLIKESETLEQQAEAVKPPPGAFPFSSAAAQAQQTYANALSGGLTSMQKKLHALGEHFKFGGGQNVRVNDAIIIPASGSSPSKAAVVTETGAVIQDRRTGDYHFGIRVRTASSNVPIERFYLDYGTTWTISPGVPPIAPAVPFGLNGNWRIIAGVGLPLNPAPTNPSVNPQGWTGQGTKYSQRGHLIANRFWGPNGQLDNIVAMTITANQSGMKTIENRVAALIISTGDIYTIEAQPLPPGKQPPDEIEVRATKIYPPPRGAPQVFGPVDNT